MKRATIWPRIRRLLILRERDEACPLQEFRHIPFHAGQQFIDKDGDGGLQCLKQPEQIQLFFDLFFVAALTAFGADPKHDIKNAGDFKDFVSFFTIVWFTWLQIAMYDLRFGFESVFERIFKAANCAIMIGIAVISPGYQIWGKKDHEQHHLGQDDETPFWILLLMLLISRLILCVQYGITIFYLRKSKSIMLVVAHFLTVSISAMVFASLLLLYQDVPRRSVTVCCVLMLLEAGFILGLSYHSSDLTLHKTCIEERMGLLTLIVLGEGALRLCHAAQKSKSGMLGATGIVSGITSGIAIAYCAWTFYFDQHRIETMGSLRQPVWVISHYLYHLAALATLDGASHLIYHKDSDASYYFVLAAGLLLLLHGWMYFTGNR